MIRLVGLALVAVLALAYLGGPVPHPGHLDWAQVWATATQAHSVVCHA